MLPKLTLTTSQIDYTAFSLTIPERVQFRRQLEGVDKDWQPVTRRRQATHTDPPPGETSLPGEGIEQRWCLERGRRNARFFDRPGLLPDALVSKLRASLHSWLRCGDFYRLRLRQVAHQMTNQFNLRLEERRRAYADRA